MWLYTALGWTQASLRVSVPETRLPSHALHGGVSQRLAVAMRREYRWPTGNFYKIHVY